MQTSGASPIANLPDNLKRFDLLTVAEVMLLDLPGLKSRSLLKIFRQPLPPIQIVFLKTKKASSSGMMASQDSHLLSVLMKVHLYQQQCWQRSFGQW